MKKITFLLAALAFGSLNSYGQWEQTSFPTSFPNDMYVTSDGKILVAEYSLSENGGLYMSTDKGATFDKVEIPDYSYTAFLESNGYTFLFGSQGRIMRTADFTNWDLLDISGYYDLNLDEIGEIYSAMEYKGKIFCTPFGTTPIYTEDNGNTWVKTDVASLEIPAEVGEKCFVYTMCIFNDELYLFDATNAIFTFNEEDDTWTKVSDQVYMSYQAVVMNDRMYVGSAVWDATATHCVYVTEDGAEYTAIETPLLLTAGALNSMDKYEDNIYIASSGGIFYTSDEGATWANFFDGLPAVISIPAQGDRPGFDLFGTPTSFAFHDGDMYVCVFQAGGKGGVFKRPIPTEHSSSIAMNQYNADADVFYSASDMTLRVDCESVPEVFVYNTSGVVCKQATGNVVDMSSLPEGVYIYRVETGDKAAVGKFVK